MINRYHGNSGRVVRVEEEAFVDRTGKREDKHCDITTQRREEQSKGYRSTARSGKGTRSPDPGIAGAGQNILSRLGRLLPGEAGKPGALETEDVILLLILYLMYRESGDSELLMMMGAMFLL